MMARLLTEVRPVVADTGLLAVDLTRQEALRLPEAHSRLRPEHASTTKWKEDRP